MILLLLFSFFAGIITILSPCIISLLPILLATTSDQHRYKQFGIIIGLIISFSLFTLGITAIVHITGISPDIFRYIALGIIFFFGLTMVIPSFDTFFTRLTSRISHIGTTLEQTSSQKQNFLSGFILGTALGLVWTPCAGPILATITLLASTKGISLITFLMTLAYTFGAALPMLLIMYGGTTIMQKTHFLIPYTNVIKKIFGFLIIFVALTMAFNKNLQLETYLTRYFPTLSIESHPLIMQELEKLKPKSDYHMNTNNIHAPQLIGLTHWINSKPLSLEELHGKVVLLDFWTYSCINCIRTLPYLKKWYQTYKPYGFEIIGIHTPEFAFEKNVKNVEAAVKKFDLTYPIALDNDYTTWQAYDVHYWPSHYLINQKGMIVSHHFGEGNYKETENNIRKLLGLQSLVEKVEIKQKKLITPEIYLGYERADKYQPGTTIYKDQIHSYEYKTPLNINTIGLQGPWLIKKDCITSENTCTINLHFIAHTVYIVMESPTPQEITILLDGQPVPKKYYTKDMQSTGKIIVHEPRMYEVVNFGDEYHDHVISIIMPKEISIYTFTFG